MKEWKCGDMREWKCGIGNAAVYYGNVRRENKIMCAFYKQTSWLGGRKNNIVELEQATKATYLRKGKAH